MAKPTPNSPPIARSLVTKFSAFVACVMILLATLTTWIGLELARADLSTEIHERLQVVAHNREALLSSYLTLQHERAHLIATRTRLRRYLANRAAEPEFEAGTRRILNDALSSSDGLLEISIADPRGVVVTTTDPSQLGRDCSQSSAFREGRVRGHLAQPWREPDGSPRARLSAPMLDSTGRLLGVVLVTIDATPLQDLLADRTGLGHTGKVSIATREGDRLLAFMPPPGAAPSLSVADAPALLRATQDDQGHGLETHRGHEVLVAWRPVELQHRSHRRWGMVVMIDASEALHPVTTLFRVQWGLSLIAIALSCAIAFLLASRLLRPVLELTETAKAFAHGQLDARVRVRSRDEFGCLSQSFNLMAESISAAQSELERRVDERTIELARANEALAQSNGDLQQFAYVASHDLLAPLRAIQNLSTWIEEDLEEVDLPQGTRRHLELLRARGTRMQALLNGLLEYSRAGRQDYDVERTDLSHLTTGVAQLLAPPPGIEVSVAIDLPPIDTQRVPLEQVLRNLIGNAIKHHDRPTGRIEVSARDAGLVYEFTVRDDGPGIPTEYHERVFKMFQTLRSRDEVEGSGIGLALVQTLVERNGGAIHLDPEDGRGCCFRFTWPKVEPEQAAPPARRAA